MDPAVTSNGGEFAQPLDVLVVGAGFAGLYLLHLLRSRGHRALAVEAGSGVGGTWYWNRYPGARCDIPSIEYSYSFSPELEQEWCWSERYAAQGEILSYLEHVAERFDLKRSIRFDARVVAARWNPNAALWQVELAGEHTLQARYVILATGALSAPKLPNWPGLDQFRGEILHTAQWRDDVDLRGKRVGVVGTGSSGIQVAPQIAAVAAHLTIFQRTPSFAVPAGNRPLEPGEQARLLPRMAELRNHARNSPLGWFDGPGPGSAKADTPEGRERRFGEYWEGGTTGLLRAYEDLLFDEESNAFAADFARGKIAAQVRNGDTVRKMTPQGYPIGARRLCSEIGYFEAMNRSNVDLVDLREEPVVEVRPDALVTEGQRYPLDILVFATGFDALTGAIKAIDISGRDGKMLTDEWADGPRSYLGLAISGFPNLFMVAGAGSPSVFSNVVVSIEQHAEWIADCLDNLRARGAATIEAEAADEQAWMLHVDEVAHMTIVPRGDSWYKGRTRDGREVFLPYLGGVGAYRAKCAEVAHNGYTGFTMT